MNASLAAGLGVGGFSLVTLLTIVLVIRSFANKALKSQADAFKAQQAAHGAYDEHEEALAVIADLERALAREKRTSAYLRDELYEALRAGPVLDPGAALADSLRRFQERHGSASDESGEGASGVHGADSGRDQLGAPAER